MNLGKFVDFVFPPLTTPLLLGLCAYNLKDKEVCLSDLKNALGLFEKHGLGGDQNFEEVVVHIKQMLEEVGNLPDEEEDDDMAD